MTRDLTIDYENLQETLVLSDVLDGLLDEALQRSREIIELAEASEWTGRAYSEFMLVVTILDQYSTELAATFRGDNGSSKGYKNVLIDLKNSMDDFRNTPEIQEMRGLT